MNLVQLNYDILIFQSFPISIIINFSIFNMRRLNLKYKIIDSFAKRKFKINKLLNMTNI